MKQIQQQQEQQQLQLQQERKQQQSQHEFHQEVTTTTTTKKPWKIIENITTAQNININTSNSKYIVCPTTDVYRKFARIMSSTAMEESSSTSVNRTRSNTRILEIGCCTGQTTELFLQSSSKIKRENILAVDISSQFIQQCQTNLTLSKIQFEQIDVLFEWGRLQDLICRKWENQDQEELIVFIDIGGNREIESVLAIIQKFLLLPIQKQLQQQPKSMIVKSQALYDYATKHHDGPSNSLNDWDTLQTLIKNRLHQRRSQIQSKQIQKNNEKDYALQQQQQQQADQSHHHQRYYHRHRHPLKMPQRYIILREENDRNTTGDVSNNNKQQRRIAICRYHNYDKQNGCLLYNNPHNFRQNQEKKACLLDHDHCHCCLKNGHIALNCPNIQCII